jgi:hypothetical protein
MANPVVKIKALRERRKRKRKREEVVEGEVVNEPDHRPLPREPETPEQRERRVHWDDELWRPRR